MMNSSQNNRQTLPDHKMKEQLEELKTRNLQLFNWLLETEKENANMRDRLEELGELEELIEDGSIKDRNSTYSPV